MTPAGAEEILRLSDRYRVQFHRSGGSYFLHLSDEFYLLSGRSFPSIRAYEGFPQLENGVGFSRRFLAEFKKREKSLPKSLKQERSCLIMTAKMACVVLRPIVDRLSEIRNLKIDLVPVENFLFGPTVTVAGLLAGRDFRESLRGMEPDTEVLIPRSSLRDEDEAFLDDLSLSELMAGSQGKVVAVENRADSLLRLLMMGEKQ
jgi:NifB/MoaA-like Fe-S oxidoreductase